MRRHEWAMVAAVCLAMAGRVSAGEGPSFSLEEAAWPATEVVVVAQGKTADAPVTVLEVWKGSLMKGAEIRVEDLPFAPLEMGRGFGVAREMKPVGGERVVLFLRHVAAAQAGATMRPADAYEGTALHGGTQVSAVWIDGGVGYAYMQEMNPGPTELTRVFDTEAELKKQTDAILAVREALEKACAVGNPAERAAALRPMASGANWHARREAFAALGACGKVALPMLKGMLRDDRYEQMPLVQAIAAAAQEDAGKEMTAILQEELGYWRKIGPTLKVGWWNADPMEATGKLRERYALIDTPLRVLAPLHYQGAAEVVMGLRKFWVSLPQLNDKSGLEQIVEECDKVLDGLVVPKEPAGPPLPGSALP